MFGKKGQAAMEYLMTYGWALLVIFIVIAVLYFLSQGFGAGEQCTFNNPGLTCNVPNVPIVVGTGGAIKGKISNGFGKAIYVDSIGCTANSSINPAAGTSLAASFGSPTGTAANSVKSISASVPAQGTLDMAGQSLICTDANGAVLAMGAGSDYRGAVYVMWRYADDPSTACNAAGNYCRVSKATLTVKTQ